VAKAVIAGKLDDAQRRAGWFQLSDPEGARNAAFDLHAHAPTLAGLLSESLAPTEHRPAPVGGRSRGGWGIGIILVVLMNVVRMLIGTTTSTPTSYRGQSDPAAYYRPKPLASPDSYATSKPIAAPNASEAAPPANNSVKIDKATQVKMVQLAQGLEAATEKTASAEERWIIQRARFLRAAIETGDCTAAEVELNGFVTDMLVLSDPLKSVLLPKAKTLASMFRTACAKKETTALQDGGPKKP